MSNMLKLLAILGLGAVLVGGGWFYYSNTGTPPPGSDQGFSEEEVDKFTERMRAETVVRVGQPIEGFEPSMFMQAFPGLIASDFADVDALIGLYRYQNGEVVYDLNGEVETHSAARAISDEGMAQILANISSRITFMQGADMLAQVFAAISPASPGETPSYSEGEEVIIEGEITCLPFKGDGPHIEICSFGLKANNGTHFGLSGLWDVAPSLNETNIDVVISGTFEAAPANESYDIVGYINVTSAQKISGS